MQQYSLRGKLSLGLLLLALASCGGNNPQSGSSSGEASVFTPQIQSLARPDNVAAPLWQALQGQLARVLATTGAERAVASAPADEGSRVNDLAVSAQLDGSARFFFTYRCSGDYDQNSEVNIGDLTPIGVYFGHQTGDANWAAAQLADGDHNGEVNIADITPIGVHFLKSIDGYLLESAPSDSPEDNWQSVAELPFSSAVFPAVGEPKQFTHDLAAPVAEAYYRVTPFDGTGAGRSLGLPSVAVYFSPTMLQPPTNLQASDGLFTDHIALSWDKSTGATEYSVYRDTQDTALTVLGDVATWDDTAVSDTLPHTYWVRAGDGTRLSNLSASDTGFLATVNPTLDPPTNVQASDGTFTDHIQISWTKVTGAVDYKVFRDSKSNLLGNAGDSDSYNDSSVTDTLPHTYWVKALDAASGESDFSLSDTGWQSELPPALDAPADVAASDGTFDDRVQITWTKVSGAVDYKVYRDEQGSLLGSAGDNSSFDDLTVPDALAHMYWVKAVDAASAESDFSLGDTGQRIGGPGGNMVVLGYNDLGMHCMNEDFSELMILPPYNTLFATVIDRSENEPSIVKEGVTIEYTIPGNTFSVGKTNFWDFVGPLLGSTPAPNIGLTGNGLSGTLLPVGAGRNDWVVTGIPITPLTDELVLDPYQLALITVRDEGNLLAQTQAVVPVSWEISCNLCHGGGSISPATDILLTHDSMHGTNLANSKPVFCGNCHAQAPLGTTGLPGLPSLSGAMHSAHALRVESLGLPNPCYACHPGFETQCQRDVHYAKGLTCIICHGSMAEVGAPTRSPWVEEPRCDSCHTRAGFEFEQPNTLYRNSLGHRGISCEACHGSPHAIGPAVTARDNVQAISQQGYAGTINNCLVCHRTQPGDPFPHMVADL